MILVSMFLYFYQKSIKSLDYSSLITLLESNFLYIRQWHNIWFAILTILPFCLLPKRLVLLIIWNYYFSFVVDVQYRDILKANPSQFDHHSDISWINPDLKRPNIFKILKIWRWIGMPWITFSSYVIEDSQYNSNNLGFDINMDTANITFGIQLRFTEFKG